MLLGRRFRLEALAKRKVGACMVSAKTERRQLSLGLRLRRARGKGVGLHSRQRRTARCSNPTATERVSGRCSLSDRGGLDLLCKRWRLGQVQRLARNGCGRVQHHILQAWSRRGRGVDFHLIRKGRLVRKGGHFHMLDQRCGRGGRERRSRDIF